MIRSDRPSRPLPASLATLAALVAILAATSSLPDGAVIERSRGWIVRPLDEDGPGSGRTLTDCLALAARHLLGTNVQLAAAIAPMHALHSIEVVPEDAPRPTSRSGPPSPRVVISDLALPPPLV